MMWRISGDHVSISLRSDTVNVRKIAEKYGGGGHTAAAGFGMGITDFYNQILNEI